MRVAKQQTTHLHNTHTHTQLIHEISEDNGNVVISFPRSGSNSSKVTLKGARQCVEAVKTRIQEIVEDLVSHHYPPMWYPHEAITTCLIRLAYLLITCFCMYRTVGLKRQAS